MEEIPLLVVYPKSYFGQTQKDTTYLVRTSVIFLCHNLAYLYQTNSCPLDYANISITLLLSLDLLGNKIYKRKCVYISIYHIYEWYLRPAYRHSLSPSTPVTGITNWSWRTLSVLSLWPYGPSLTYCSWELLPTDWGHARWVHFIIQDIGLRSHVLLLGSTIVFGVCQEQWREAVQMDIRGFSHLF